MEPIYMPAEVVGPYYDAAGNLVTGAPPYTCVPAPVYVQEQPAPIVIHELAPPPPPLPPPPMVIHSAPSVVPIQPPLPPAPTTIWKSVLSKWAALVLLFEVAMVLLFIFLVEYGEGAKARKLQLPNPVHTSSYAFFQDVHVMIFIGFGFLMTFLRKYAFGALGYTLFLAVICIQFHVLINGLWHNAINAEDDERWEHKVGINLNSLLVGDFAAASVLITFGALLGKANILQLTIIAIVEIFLFSLNENIAVKLGVTDIGGSMIIHLFGAYFGVAATTVLSSKIDKFAAKTDADSVYTSDVTAMIGTIFLFMFWPSFNGAPAGSGTQQQRAVINTLLSMTGSVAMSFLASPTLNSDHQFNMVDIQNATISGGVAMGAIADMNVGPGFAILIGLAAGLLSVIGYSKITPLLERIGIHDTCGVHNLHGMPAIFSAILSAIYCAIADEEDYESDFPFNFPKRAETGRKASEQAGIQMAVFGITLGIALFGGLVAGAVARAKFFADPVALKKPFNDSPHWEVPKGTHHHDDYKYGHIQSPQTPQSPQSPMAHTMGPM